MRRDVGSRVLIADDDSSFCDVVAELLITEGYSPHTVPTSDEALAALVAEEWALMLLDTLGTRPGESFLAMLRAIAAAARGTPVLLVTGWTENANSAEAKAPSPGFSLNRSRWTLF